MKMTTREALAIADRIDHGHSDFITADRRYAPLWQHHFLLESYIAMLRHHGSASGDFHRANFRNVCSIMAPEFLYILGTIDFESVELDDSGLGRHMEQRESDRVSL